MVSELTPPFPAPVDGALRLCYKRATLDQESLSDHGALSIIF